MDTRLLQDTLDRFPSTRFLQLRLTGSDVVRHCVTLRMPMRPEIERAPGSGQFQGGCVATLLDTAGVYAILLVHQVVAPTTHLAVEYLRPVVGAFVDARGVIRRAGRSFAVVDIEAIDPGGQTCVLGRATYAMAPEVAKPLPEQ